MEFKVGDLVLAPKTHDYDNPHWEWCTGLNVPADHAIVIEVNLDYYQNERYHVQFTDGRVAHFYADELKIVAFA